MEHITVFTVDEKAKDYLIYSTMKYLKNPELIKIENSLLHSFRNFLKEKNINFRKDESYSQLAKKIVKIFKPTDKKLVIVFNKYLPSNPIKFTKKAFEILKELKPVIIANQNIYDEVFKNLEEFEEKKVILDGFIKASTVSKEIECYKCKMKNEILIGIETMNKVYPVIDFNKNLPDFFKKYFNEHNFNLTPNKSLLGFYVNSCKRCGAKFDNLYIYEEYYLKGLNNKFKDFKKGITKEIPFVDFKKSLF